MCMCVHAHVCVRVRVCMYVCVCVCMHMCVCSIHPGFWGSEESLDGSDPQLTMSPAATLTEEDNEDFYF